MRCLWDSAVPALPALGGRKRHRPRVFPPSWLFHERHQRRAILSESSWGRGSPAEPVAAAAPRSPLYSAGVAAGTDPPVLPARHYGAISCL